MTDARKSMPPRSKRGVPTVSAGYASYLVAFAVTRGADAAQLAARAEIRLDDLEDPDGRVPFASYVALMKAAKELCRTPAFALELGTAKDFREITVVGLICYAAPTMGEALKELNRYGRLVAELDVPAQGARFQVRPRDGALWLVDTRIDPNAFPELTEETWSRFISETTRHFPGAPFAKAVHVPHAAPAYRADYERIYGVPVTFESDQNAICIDPSWLELPLHQPNRYVFGVLSEHAQRLLQSLEDARTMRGRVEGFLIPILHKGDVGMDEVARALGLSRASLYRRLKEEGVSYDAVVDELRHKMALHYLSGKKVSVNETAYLVGFSDPSAFSRAFKRWTGSSPRSVKRR